MRWKATTIAGMSLRQMFRDRGTIFFTMIFPLLLIFVVGLATKGFTADRAPVGIVDNSTGQLGRTLHDAIDRSPVISLVRYKGLEALRKDVRRGVVVAGVVIPSDYDAAIRSGKTANVRFMSDPTHGFPAAVRAPLAAAIAEQGAVLEAAQFSTQRSGGTFEQNIDAAERTQLVFNPVAVTSTTVGRSAKRLLMGGFSYQAPANLTLFVFITSLAASAQLIESRRLGVTRRMLGTPTSPRTILAGQTLGRFTVALFQGLYILALGRLIFGINFGDPLAAGVLLLAFILVGTSFGVLFGTIFRTPEQAGSVGPPLGIAMGMLSGCMWPREIMPPLMQHIGQLFPQSWAMDAWIKLIARGSSITGILPQLAVLFAFVAVILPLAARRLRRSIVAA